MNFPDYQLHRARNILNESLIESSSTRETFLIENMIEEPQSECEFHFREDSRVITKAAVLGDLLWWIKVRKISVARFAKRKLLLFYTFMEGSKIVLRGKKTVKILKVIFSKKTFVGVFELSEFWCMDKNLRLLIGNKSIKFENCY